MTIWSPELASDKPKYLAIAEAMRDDLAQGRLKAGDRLPTHRELAFRLGVTTGTVTRAYAEAERMGLLVGEVGRGSFLKAPEAAAPPRAIETEPEEGAAAIDLSHASPPMVHDRNDLAAALSEMMRSTPANDLLAYTPPGGLMRHRAMGAHWLKRSGIAVRPEEVLVAAGAHAGLVSILAALSQNGERLFLEGMNYPSMKPLARHLGITLVPIEMDDQGLVPEALERAARAGEARMLYTVPTFHNPTTVTQPLARRVAVIDIARRYGLTIIEDDIFRLLDPRLQPPALHTLAPERTYHVTSLSKSLAPGLRIGFVTAPQGKLESVIRQQTVIGGRATGLAAEVARNWIETGAADRILAANIAEMAERRALALGLLGARDVKCAPHAPYLWLDLPEHWRPGDFCRQLRERGVRVASGPAFAVDRRANDQGIRISFGGAVSREGLAEALGRIVALLDEMPDHEYRTVA